MTELLAVWLEHCYSILSPDLWPLLVMWLVPQSDRRKAQSGMEAAWKSMEKKEKIPWIKKAAEDQKRYEVQYHPVVSEPRPLQQTPPTTCWGCSHARKKQNFSLINHSLHL